ncbi:MAG: arylsulfatase [Ferruginibacter sp.]|nr:arylsulfatase [Ferruginibacter sp.]
MRVAFFFICFIFGVSITAQQKPNIILIFADDLGYADVGCYGQQKTETPNIDQLAREGLKFTQFYSGSTVCAPARSSLLTGLHTGHTAIRGNKGTKPEGQTPLPDSVITIATVLQQRGYTTAAFGKWGLGYITTSGDPNTKGFNDFLGYNCQTLAHNYYPDHLWNNHERINFPENNTGNAVYSADYIHEQAMRFLSAKQHKPFFLYLPYTLPHGDVIVPHDSVYDHYVSKFNEQPAKEKAVKNDGEQHRFEPYPHAAFAAMVARLDKYTGEIIQAIKAKGIAGNTLVIFMSDNGPHRENGGDPEFFNNNGIFRGIKRDLYEGGIRVPFIAYWKGKIKPGVSTQVAALWDLYPTFQQLAGISVAKNIDGFSILPTLLKTGKQQQHEYLYWEFHENNGRQAMRWKNWKAVKLAVNNIAPPPVELYDLARDPAEQNNLAKKFPQVVKKIETLIKQAHVSNKDWPLLPAEIQR